MEIHEKHGTLTDNRAPSRKWKMLLELGLQLIGSLPNTLTLHFKIGLIIIVRAITQQLYVKSDIKQAQVFKRKPVLTRGLEFKRCGCYSGKKGLTKSCKLLTLTTLILQSILFKHLIVLKM